MGTENGKPVLMGGRSLTAEQSQWITERLSELREALATSGEAEDTSRATSIVKLQAALGNPAVPETFAEVRAEVFLDALCELPAWAVDAAAMCWVRGEGLAEDDNPNFVPKPVQIVRLAKSIMAPVRKQIVDLERLAATERKVAA